MNSQMFELFKGMEFKQRQRLERALSQRMYLIHAKNTEEQLWNFEVEGSTGTVYNVEFSSSKMSCTCPDYTSRKRICKHIYFIIGRVLRDIRLLSEMPNETPNICIFNLKGNLSEKLNIALNPRLNIHKQEIIQEIPEESCTICFEDYKKNEIIVRCHTCKNFFHKECMNVWLRNGSRCTCPLCRRDWVEFNSNDPMTKFIRLNE